MGMQVSGFIRCQNYSDKFGAFTATHQTYGKDPAIYNPDTSIYHDFEVVSLNRINDNNSHSYAPIATADAVAISNIVNWLITNASDSLTTNIATTNAKLKEMFNTATLVVVADAMIIDKNNKILPNLIQVDITTGSDTTSYTYWINASDFESEYQASDTTIFIPTATVDGLITTKENLEQIIGKITIDDYNNNFNHESVKSPYTAIRSLQTTWVNKDNSDETMIIRIAFACYGPINDDVGVLKSDLREYILKHTSQSEALWEHVLPEIFSATTFIMIPAWDATSGGLDSALIYNPIQCLSGGYNFIKENMTGFTDAHLMKSSEYLPCIWQSLGIYVCANPNNPIGSHSLRTNLKDYMLIGVTGADFIRLTTQTKDFIVKLSNYLPLIEAYIPGQVLNDLTLESIDGLNFLVYSSFNVKCKILCKADYMAIMDKKKGKK